LAAVAAAGVCRVQKQGPEKKKMQKLSTSSIFLEMWKNKKTLITHRDWKTKK